MTFEEREHCARYQYWELLTWTERLVYAKTHALPITTTEKDIAARQATRDDSRRMTSLMKSIANIDLL